MIESWSHFRAMQHGWRLWKQQLLTRTWQKFVSNGGDSLRAGESCSFWGEQAEGRAGMVATQALNICVPNTKVSGALLNFASASFTWIKSILSTQKNSKNLNNPHFLVFVLNLRWLSWGRRWVGSRTYYVTFFVFQFSGRRCHPAVPRPVKRASLHLNVKSRWWSVVWKTCSGHSDPSVPLHWKSLFPRKRYTSKDSVPHF